MFIFFSNWIRGFVLFLSSLLLPCLIVACATTPPPKVEVQYQTLALTPPDDLLVDCAITPPPTVIDYTMLKTWSGKEALLVENIAAHLAEIGACNIRWEKLRQWKKSVLKAVTVAQSASAPVIYPMQSP